MRSIVDAADIGQIPASLVLPDVSVAQQSDQIHPKGRQGKDKRLFFAEAGSVSQPEEKRHQQKRDAEGQHLSLALNSQREARRKSQEKEERRNRHLFFHSDPDSKVQQKNQKIAGIIACHGVKNLESVSG